MPLVFDLLKDIVNSYLNFISFSWFLKIFSSHSPKIHTLETNVCNVRIRDSQMPLSVCVCMCVWPRVSFCRSPNEFCDESNTTCDPD